MKGVKNFEKWIFEFSRPELAYWGGLERVLEELGESGYELLGIAVSGENIKVYLRR